METKKKRKRSTRPCPACKPGIFCAACRGAGVLSKSVERRPRIAFVGAKGNALLEPGGEWEWPAERTPTGTEYRRFLGAGRLAPDMHGFTALNLYYAPLRTGREGDDSRETVTNAQGEDGAATRNHKTRPPTDPQGAAYMRERGVGIVRRKDAAQAGMTAHRGILHPDEYYDVEELRRQVEAELGCPVAEAAELYGRGRGPLPAALRPRRAELDRRLANAENLAVLARVLGVPERTLQRAAQRGRAA